MAALTFLLQVMADMAVQVSLIRSLPLACLVVVRLQELPSVYIQL